MFYYKLINISKLEFQNKKLAPKSSSGLMKKWLYKSKNTDLNIGMLN